jgi:hypothetical protein
VLLLAIFLIASPATFYWASGRFDLKIAVICAAALAAISWGIVDAWRPRQGALHYAAGEWVLAQGGQESQGTLHVVLDLQLYLLVRFTPSDYSLGQSLGHGPTSSQQLKIKGQWLHLESAYGQDWRALRRALYAAPSVAQANATDSAIRAAGSSATVSASARASSVSPA